MNLVVSMINLWVIFNDVFFFNKTFFCFVLNNIEGKSKTKNIGDQPDY